MKKLHKLSEAKKRQLRVQIARDVIEQIISGATVPIRGVVIRDWSLGANLINESLRVIPTCSAIQNSAKRLKNCGVCAKGAVLLAHIKRHDSVSASELVSAMTDNDTVGDVKSLARIFPKKMLAEMETLFEQRGFDGNRKLLGGDELDGLVGESTMHYSKSPAARLMEIMLNLISSGGKSVTSPAL